MDVELELEPELEPERDVENLVVGRRVGPFVLWGRSLRFVLVAEMMQHREVTVAELVSHLEDLGFIVAGRPSKVVSDCLRWEVRRGRVERLGRGRYRYRSAPRSTARRIRLLGSRCRTWLDAVARGLTPPLLPRDPRSFEPPDAPRFASPPWIHLGWLWST